MAGTRAKKQQAALTALGQDAMSCRRCALWQGATRTVFGEGPADSEVCLVGEQPGDREDRTGRPFVGPAGLLLDRALSEAGVDRRKLYVTNAVKHFKNEPRGKRRLHKTPTAGEIEACRWWLERELDALRPKVVVALGASAARALVGKTVPIGRNRGHELAFLGERRGFVTIHPSALLRMRDPEIRQRDFQQFVADLATILHYAPAVEGRSENDDRRPLRISP
jgi:uracil-DNA glycosylase